MVRLKEIKISVKGTDKALKSYLQAMRLKNMTLTQLQRVEGGLTFFISSNDIIHLKRIKRHGVKVYFTDRSHVMKCRQWLMSNGHVICMSLASILLAVFLYHTLWFVEIDVKNPYDEAIILNHLRAMDIAPLKLKKNLPSAQQVSLDLKKALPQYRFFDIGIMGGIYQIVALEDTLKENLNGATYQYKSPKKGMVTSLIVYQGRRCVEVNQLVEKGEVLITGELNEKFTDEIASEKLESTRIPIKAELELNTWLKVTATYHIKQLFFHDIGEETTSYLLRINDWSFPLGLNDQDTSEEVLSKKQLLYIRPLKLTLEKIRRQTISGQTQNVTESEVYLLAQKQIAQNVLNQPNVEKIMDEKVLHQSIENGKVNVTIFFSVNESYRIE
ncbi:hypothetical protein GCM10012290_11510 [Halolactibacillus alkaliphilus]|uniref:Sporulation protein YqfD n=1 Tax=Halolactibacillus alkaliphilus TaxID=442899 RepID=A0A511X3B4_9BACI|nr:sporulation protein YqfD [Halolactibacillus alkaliphilus]GEN57415.1 hypothetical protein HAL01_18790 [Halolactibacillus alkaliphilus]GGN69130.1 hypothetical protein GCM10012290_11510 [Halolactibacillus alkaliphilus]SFO73829.1 sporulation protein YqfD [Halolactibacillus alkaliphilus]